LERKEKNQKKKTTKPDHDQKRLGRWGSWVETPERKVTERGEGEEEPLVGKKKGVPPEVVELGGGGGGGGKKKTGHTVKVLLRDAQHRG